MRNNLDTPVTIKAKLYRETSTGKIYYSEGVQDISFKLSKALTNELSVVKEEDGYLYFQLLPKSTFYVGGGSNYKQYNFSEIEILYENSKNIILDNISYELWETKGRSCWYDIK
ncbi:MAG: hypothetical protein AAF741_18585 [Bacteroidota bacterium]